MNEEPIETPSEAAEVISDKKEKMFVCSMEDWTKIVQILGNCPAHLTSSAWIFMTSKQPVSVTVHGP